MVNKLKAGTSDDNDLLHYLRGSNGHASSTDFCSGNSNNSPCFELKIWCAKEGCSGSSSGSSPLGKITSNSSAGLLKGWARDPDNVNQAVTVEIYANGPRGSGSFLTSTVANLSYASAEVSGNVGFQYQLPAAYADGVQHTYYIYAQDTQSATTFAQVALSPKAATAYSPRTTALNKWNADVLPTLNSSCTGCHGSWTFSAVLYSGFINSSGVPAGATANSFYQKITGGISHGGGGNFCNGNNLCTNLQAAYNLQFN